MAGKQGLDMLMSQYVNSVNLKAYIKCILDEFAEVKQALNDVVKYRYLADSFGVQVDDIAYLVGASRTIYGAASLGFFGFYTNSGAYPAGDDNDPTVGGVLRSDSDRESGDFVRSDTQLKNAIKARVLKITGNCTVEQMIQYVELVLGRSVNLEIIEGHQTLAFKIHETLSVVDKVLLSYMLPDFKPSGIAPTLADNAGSIALVYNSTYFPPET